MAGLGGSLGYTIGAIDWSSSLSNNSFSAHVQTVFAMITVAFIASVTLTMTSFSEVPLNHLKLLQSDEYVLEENSEIPTNVKKNEISLYFLISKFYFIIFIDFSSIFAMRK